MDFDKYGNLWLATREGNQVFRIDMTTRKVHHVAGTVKRITGHGGSPKELD